MKKKGNNPKKDLGRVGINPKEAREKGFFTENGHKYFRREKYKHFAESSGKTTEVSFSFKVSVSATYGVIDARFLEPSHLGSQENPMHFIPDAQPRNRAMSESGAKTPISIAQNLRPAEVCEGSTAYTGCPVVNPHGEVIQGNGRAYAMKHYWSHFANDPKNYRAYLLQNADFYGSSKTKIKEAHNPVLVRVVAVSDAEAIKLGQYTQTDLEAVQSQTDRVKGRINLIDDAELEKTLASAFEGIDDNASVSELIQGSNLIKKLVKLGAVSTDELEIFLKNDRVNEEGIRYLTKLLLGLVFKGMDGNVPNAFEYLPFAAKNGIVKSLPYILRVPQDRSIKKDIAESVLAHREFEADKGAYKDAFAWAKNPTIWGPAPNQKYSPLAILLVNYYNTLSVQKNYVNAFRAYAHYSCYRPATLVEPAHEPWLKADALNKVFGLDIPKETAKVESPAPAPREAKPTPAPPAPEPTKAIEPKPKPKPKAETPKPATVSVKAKEQEPPAPKAVKPKAPTAAQAKKLESLRKSIGAYRHNIAEQSKYFDKIEAIVQNYLKNRPTDLGAPPKPSPAWPCK